MAVKITTVESGSVAEKSGIRVGDCLIAVNNNKIRDVLDYRYYMTDRHVEVLLRRENSEYTVTITKQEYADIGLEFDTYLMDNQQSCTNKCIFCFVDQTPKGMRPSLYFKDDDSRMSFFFGNYITMTNMSEEDIARIIKMKISPINVSVHTTNPELRVFMMKNPRAATSLSYLPKLVGAGLKVNAQLVLCPGINDGKELERTLNDLADLGENLVSIACVPVGLTDHREGLPKLEPYTKETALETIGIIHRFAERQLEKTGRRLAYPSDEFFLMAELPIPEPEYYGDFDQLDNGVGLLALFQQEFEDAIALEDSRPVDREVSLATGVAAYDFICGLSRQAEQHFPGLKVRAYRIVNDFFGHQITVAGLVTGTDLCKQLAGKALGETLILPSTMLRHEQDMFLDDVTREQAQQSLNIPISVIPVDGFEFLDALIGNK